MGLCTPYVDGAEGRKTICTSTTRPTGADIWPGKEIFETNTTRSWIYTGSAWVLTSWATSTGRPGVILTDTAQSIPNGTATDVTWSTEVADVDGWTSGASATLTVPTGWGALYSVSYTGAYATSPGSPMAVAAMINGGVTYAASSTFGASWGAPTLSFTRALAATDTVKIQVVQSSGGAVNLTSRLEIIWLGV